MSSCFSEGRWSIKSSYVKSQAGVGRAFAASNGVLASTGPSEGRRRPAQQRKTSHQKPVMCTMPQFASRRLIRRRRTSLSQIARGHGRSEASRQDRRRAAPGDRAPRARLQAGKAGLIGRCHQPRARRRRRSAPLALRRTRQARRRPKQQSGCTGMNRRRQ